MEIHGLVFPALKAEFAEREGFGIWHSRCCCHTAKDACITFERPLNIIGPLPSEYGLMVSVQAPTLNKLLNLTWFCFFACKTRIIVPTV